MAIQRRPNIYPIWRAQFASALRIAFKKAPLTNAFEGALNAFNWQILGLMFTSLRIQFANKTAISSYRSYSDHIPLISNYYLICITDNKIEGSFLESETVRQAVERQCDKTSGFKIKIDPLFILWIYSPLMQRNTNRINVCGSLTSGF
jgi:hypothetical protein